MAGLLPAVGFCDTAAPDDLGNLRTELRSQYADARRRAVTKLCELGSEAALELVLRSLADPSPEVADEAQLGVVKLEAVGAVEALLGKGGIDSKNALVQRRAAEALGRAAGPVDGAKLGAALDRRDPELTRTLLWSLERLAFRQALGGKTDAVLRRMEPFLGSRADDGVRAAALQTLVRIAPPKARTAIAELGADGGPETASSALIARHALADPGLVPALEAALVDARPAVRASAIQLATVADVPRSTLLALLARLDDEPRPCLRERVLATLRHLTGLRHGAKAKAWAHAIGELAEDWTSASTVEPYRADASDAGSVAVMQRFTPASDRLAILIDFSGSLWSERPNGTRRKDLLDPEMVGLLGRLDPDATFQLIPFTDKPHPFSRKPERATAHTIEKAQRFLERATMRGKGNLHGALLLALEDRETDRVSILTDGAPTGGIRWNVGLMIELIRERTRFRPIVFDFVLVDTPKGLAKRWRELSEGTGGRFVAIDTE